MQPDDLLARVKERSSERAQLQVRIGELIAEELAAKRQYADQVCPHKVGDDVLIPASMKHGGEPARITEVKAGFVMGCERGEITWFVRARMHKLRQFVEWTSFDEKVVW